MNLKRNTLISLFVLSFSSNAFAVTKDELQKSLYKYCIPSNNSTCDEKYRPIYTGKKSVADNGYETLCGCNNNKYSFLYYPASYVDGSGKTVENLNRECMECPTGYIADPTNVTKCKEVLCPAGFYGQVVIGPSNCPAGFYSHTSLSPCPLSTYKWNY